MTESDFGTLDAYYVPARWRRFRFSTRFGQTANVRNGYPREPASAELPWRWRRLEEAARAAPHDGCNDANGSIKALWEAYLDEKNHNLARYIGGTLLA